MQPRERERDDTIPFAACMLALRETSPPRASQAGRLSPVLQSSRLMTSSESLRGAPSAHEALPDTPEQRTSLCAAHPMLPKAAGPASSARASHEAQGARADAIAHRERSRAQGRRWPAAVIKSDPSASVGVWPVDLGLGVIFGVGRWIGAL